MSLGTEPHVINFSPHPRLLSVLGDIEFAPWQCVAELIVYPEFPIDPGQPPTQTPPTLSATN